ncbi:uncharacterized protein LOC141535171 [Cotesia typhae]|uniref:uncharacterized protein LOC141535171 n=1 Tax=Cotesia typhae TaxID=2053667 RepID=UPI003D698B55
MDQSKGQNVPPRSQTLGSSVDAQRQLRFQPLSEIPTTPKSKTNQHQQTVLITKSTGIQHQHGPPGRPTTPISQLTTPNRIHQTKHPIGQLLTPRSGQQHIKLLSGTGQVMVQSKEGPEILKLLKENFQMIESRFASLNTKLDQAVVRFDTLEANMNSSKFFTGAPFDKPSTIPFKTQADILQYDESTSQQREQMRNYLLFYNMHDNVKSNMRSILQYERLMTDELLTDVIWKGKKGQKTSKLTLLKKCITHDLRTVMQQMYPSMTFTEFKGAVITALNAANARVYEKKKKLSSKRTRKNKDAKAVKSKKLKMSDEDFFKNEWNPKNYNTEDEEISDEDENEDGDDVSGDDENTGDRNEAQGHQDGHASSPIANPAT